MAYRVEASDQAEIDLGDILQFLYESFRAFGDDDRDAFDRAAARVRAIRQAMRSLGPVPHQGTLRPDLGPGLRNVTKDRAILYFEVDDGAERVRILAVFFGGQDHRGAMLRRLAAGPGGG